MTSVTQSRHASMVGLEPSCLFTLRDEFLSLGLGEAARATADNAFLFEEFLAREKKAAGSPFRSSRWSRRPRCCTAIATRRRSAR